MSSKRTATMELVGVHCVGPEDDYLVPIPNLYSNLDGNSLASLVRQAGVESVDWTIPSTLGAQEDLAPDYLDSYREKTRRQYPKLYRWKVTLVAEELSEEETTRLWEEHRRLEKLHYADVADVVNSSATEE